MTIDLSNFTADQIHMVPAEACRLSPVMIRNGAPEGSTAIQTDDSLWVLRVYSKHQGHKTNFALYFRNAAMGTRLEYGGPIVHEDTGFMVALPTVIALHRGPIPIVHDANVGDIVIFAGHIWQITEDRAFHDPTLTLVS